MRFHQKLLALIITLSVFFNPTHWQKRTLRQRQFEKTLTFVFISCFAGTILIALLLWIKEKPTLQPPEAIKISKAIPDPELPKLPKTREEELLLNIEKGEIKLISLSLNKRETLSGLLKRAGLSMTESLEVGKAMELATNIRLLRQGQIFELLFNKENVFYGLKMEDRKGNTISVFKNIDGTFTPQAQEGKIETKIVTIQGIIENNFSQAAQKASVPKTITHQVTQALDGEIDFRTDIKEHSPFTIVFEKKMTQTGREIGRSSLLYVSLTSNKKTYNRYYFIDASGNPGFYNENGESAPKIIMKRPLGSGRISSYFGTRRHPILKYQKHHSGVDFPAPKGTPIPAGADGLIVKMGRNGAYGKYIRIQHTNSFSTAYGHLSAFHKELKVGSYIKRGDIIGYVGSTGRSTGTHLHYEVIKNGVQVNPLQTYTIPKRTLKNSSLANFKKVIEKVSSQIHEIKEPLRSKNQKIK